MFHLGFGGARFARLAVPVAALALALAACTSGGGASPSADAGSSGEPPAAATLEGTPWQLTDYAGPAGNTLPVPEAVAATANFDAGKISGNAGCNSYNGTYTVDGDKLTISGLAMTAMACPEPQMALEKAFTTALEKVEAYAVSGSTLELKLAEGKIGLRFAVAEAPALTGTRWVAAMINNGKGATQSVVAGTEVTAIFAEDGTVSGSGGCNTFNGSYTTDGATIKIGPLASTKMACADEAASAQEAAYFAALEASATYAFSGDALELRAADGALQVSFNPTLP